MTIRIDISDFVSLLALSTLTLMLSTAPAAFAAGRPDTLCFNLYFSRGSAAVDPDYRNNTAVIDSLHKIISGGGLRSLRIVSSSSPEGDPLFNHQLSRRRSASTLVLLNLPDSIPVEIRSVGAVEATIPETSYPDFRTSEIQLALRSLKKLPYPDTTLLPKLTDGRQSDFITNHINNSRPKFEITGSTDTYINNRPWLTLHINLLLTAAAIPNIGVILPLGRGWAVVVDGYYADWHKRSRARFWRLQGAEVSVRKAISFARSNYWFVNAYTQLFRYNICLGSTGCLSAYSGAPYYVRPSYGLGLGGGYNVSLSRHFSLDFEFGAGYIGGQYQTYRPVDGHNVWLSTRRRSYFGLTKAAITLNWYLWKGGQR